MSLADILLNRSAVGGYVQGRQRYLGNRSPGLIDVLAASGTPLGATMNASGAVTDAQNPLPVGSPAQHPQSMTDLAAPLVHVSGHGVRAGQAYQSFDLGGGQTAHVYYDRQGRRKVMVF